MGDQMWKPINADMSFHLINLWAESKCQSEFGAGTLYLRRWMSNLHLKAVLKGSVLFKQLVTLHRCARNPLHLKAPMNLRLPRFSVCLHLFQLMLLPCTTDPNHGQVWLKTALSHHLYQVISDFFWKVDMLIWRSLAIFSHEKCMERKYSTCSFVIFNAALPAPLPRTERNTSLLVWLLQ